MSIDIGLLVQNKDGPYNEKAGLQEKKEVLQSLSDSDLDKISDKGKYTLAHKGLDFSVIIYNTEMNKPLGYLEAYQHENADEIVIVLSPNYQNSEMAHVLIQEALQEAYNLGREKLVYKCSKENIQCIINIVRNSFDYMGETTDSWLFEYNVGEEF